MHIVFLEPLGVCECVIRSLCKPLQEKGHTFTFYADRREEEPVLIERSREADAIVLSNIPLRKSFFDACPRLKMISVAFTGLDHIDLEACRARGITVCNAAGYSTHAVAELAIGMMLDVYRQIANGNTITRMYGSRNNFTGSELRGKTVGIIGLGRIGRQVATLASAFGCRVIGYNRTPRTLEQVTSVDKETLCREADILSVHLPLTPDTENFIDSREFSLMQPHAILINTARGPVVNKEALCQALTEGRIAGAAVDVYDREPPLSPGDILFGAPNLLMLPHLGYATREAFAERIKIVVQNITNWIA
ncbi:MAG: hydroxyacid dehydrogenase [Culturomica sp.]|jgi:D-3-phosphoglycerate dehydrogenase|nr:hydroxyacid dehydrogenase [Culturomica sp.]